MKGKYEDKTQAEYEAIMNKSGRAEGKKTDRWAETRCQSGVDLGNLADAKPMAPTGVSGEKELLAESKKKEK